MEPDPSESLLAWRIFQAIEKLGSLLFDRYDREFLDFDGEEGESPSGSASAQAQETMSWEEVEDDPLGFLSSGRSEE